MQPYRDLRGDSGIVAYEVDRGWIKVQFKHGGTYLYDATAPGTVHVAAMTRLARAGDGLNTYINEHVRKNYSQKLS
jgi:hypothetical protein